MMVSSRTESLIRFSESQYDYWRWKTFAGVVGKSNLIYSIPCRRRHDPGAKKMWLVMVVQWQTSKMKEKDNRRIYGML